MPQPVRISLMRSTAGTASKHSNTQKTVVEDGVNKLPEAAKEERKKLFLPLIFIAYLGGITLFTHSHVVNGVIIVHSHPFKGEHQHTEVELETIFFLSSFAASGSLFTPSSTTVFWVLLCLLAVPAVERIKLIRTGCGIYLRAPPAVC